MPTRFVTISTLLSTSTLSTYTSHAIIKSDKDWDAGFSPSVCKLPRDLYSRHRHPFNLSDTLGHGICTIFSLALLLFGVVQILRRIPIPITGLLYSVNGLLSDFRFLCWYLSLGHGVSASQRDEQKMIRSHYHLQSIRQFFNCDRNWI